MARSNGTIRAADLCDSAIKNRHVVDDAITETKISDLSISTPKLAANAVTAAKIAAGTITATEISSNTITASEIAAGAITTSELAANAVTAAKIAANTITASEIAANAINTSELAANSVTATEINVSTLDAIAATMGTLTVNATLTMSGSGKIRTAASGSRIELGTGTSWMTIHNSSGTLIGTFGGASGTVSLQASAGVVIDINSTGDCRIGSTANRLVASDGSASVWIETASVVRATFDAAGITTPSTLSASGGTMKLRAGTTEILNSTATETRLIRAYVTTGTGDATVGVTSTGLLRRQTSAAKYKTNIAEAMWLADIPLRPVEYDSLIANDDGQPRHLYGLIADDIAAALPRAGIYGPDGDLENYQDRAVLAILAAKVRRLEQRSGLRSTNLPA